MRLRAASPADAAAVAACVDAAYRHYIARIGKLPGPMLDDFAEVLRMHRCYVLEEDATIVALAVLVVEPERALLDNVAVLPAWQGRGLGRRLIAHVEDEARRLGYAEFARRTEKGFRRVYLRKVLPAGRAA